jgi:hypothetical protein
MEDREQTSFAQNLNRIRDLNDRLRVSGEGGRIVMTSSIAYVPLDVRTSAISRTTMTLGASTTLARSQWKTKSSSGKSTITTSTSNGDRRTPLTNR